MAKKKSKRPNLPQETLERARAEMRGERITAVDASEIESTNGTMAVAAKAKVKRPVNTASRRVPSTQELLSEYAYVLKDLRNLIILAGILMAIIIVMALVLPRPTG